MIRQVTYDNALAVYGLSGTMREADWLDPASIDQRGLFEGNSVLRGGQTHASSRSAARSTICGFHDAVERRCGVHISATP